MLLIVAVVALTICVLVGSYGMYRIGKLHQNEVLKMIPWLMFTLSALVPGFIGIVCLILGVVEVIDWIVWVTS